MTEGYNYEHFPPDLDGASFEAFQNGLRVGASAPDCEANGLSHIPTLRFLPTSGATQSPVMF